VRTTETFKTVKTQEIGKEKEERTQIQIKLAKKNLTSAERYVYFNSTY
jgi:hypothetical protein